MTDPIPLDRRHDDGDERYDYQKQEGADAPLQARIDALTREQIELLYEQAEAQYDRELGWASRRAAEKMLDTDDPDAYRDARKAIAESRRMEDRRYDRWARACENWKKARSKP